VIPLDRGSLTGLGLGVVALGCLVFVVSPYLSGDVRAEKRRETFTARRTTRAVDRATEAASRRKQVVDSLKEVEQRGRSKKATLEIRIQRAGLSWTRKSYVLMSVGLGVGLGALAFVADSGPVIAASAALAGGFGLPSWILSHLMKRRLARFTDGFPGAVDIIVRGVKAGLPLGDCLRVMASETPEPLRSEFRRVVESQSVGLSVSEAVDRLAERVPITETNFFSIVIGIQQKAGGNLTEALGNLSRVIRERKKMKAKVKAVSSEAKASASIIGALPFVVGTLVWLVSPDYISLLWTTSTGRMMMAAGACWMGIGIFVMKQMINFDI
jgi:tight adherence protein B